MRTNRIQEEAAEWAVKARFGPLTTEEEASLQAWLSADMRHRGAYVRALAVEADVRRVSALAGGRVPVRARTSVRAPAALAAGLALLAVAIGWGWFAYQGVDRYTSAVGELRKISLQDGSSIVLNTATEAIARIDRRERRIELPRGEMLVEVARDPSRPFTVRAGGVLIEALGTAFAVRREEQRVDVIVTEGVVQIARGGESPVRLTANQRAVVSTEEPIVVETMERREIERRLAWQTGRIEFDGQALGEAVAQINRHSQRQVVVSDPELSRRPVVGVFRTTDIESFAKIAAEALDARVVEDGALIRIEPRAP